MNENEMIFLHKKKWFTNQLFYLRKMYDVSNDVTEFMLYIEDKKIIIMPYDEAVFNKLREKYNVIREKRIKSNHNRIKIPMCILKELKNDNEHYILIYRDKYAKKLIVQFSE